MFRVGQKVECFGLHDKQPRYGEIMASLGEVYTVRGIRTRADGRVGILLSEITNKPLRYRGYTEPVEPCYLATRFRPIVSRPTSIEFAHEILRSVSAPTKERAHV